MGHLSFTATRRGRFTLVLSAVILLPTLARAADTPLSGFLGTYCVRCHNSQTTKGGLDLEKLRADFKDPAAFASWVKVHDRIQAGEMPPKACKERPGEAESEAIVKGLEAGLSDLDRSRRAGAGRAVLRRLNREEYENTLRDLFGLSGLKIMDMLPEDGRAFGFDKSAAGLDLSYVQMTKYMAAADLALDAAIAPHAARPPLCKAHIPGGGVFPFTALAGNCVFLKDFKYDDSVIPIPKGRPKGADAMKLRQAALKAPYSGTIGVLTPENVAEFQPRIPFTAAYAGRYKVRMSLWSFVWNKGKVEPNARIESAALVAEGRTLGYFDAPSLRPTVTEIEVWLNPMTNPRDKILFVASTLLHHPLGANLEKFVGAGIAVDWVEIEGPLMEQWPSPGHRRLFGDLPLTALAAPPKNKGKAKTKEPVDVHMPRRPLDTTLLRQSRERNKSYITNLSSLPKSIAFSTVATEAPEADARRLLANFLPRAFRRPVADVQVQRYLELVKARLADGDMFEVAMRTAYKAALCSPDFLFLKEPAPIKGSGTLTSQFQTPLLEPAGTLDDWAVASRLSYFLWNSMPDDALFALARQGKLHDEAVLRGQVERMLKDPKAERFIANFTDQWLNLQDIDETTPNKRLYPEFRRVLRDSMVAETRAFFRELLEKDLGAANVVHSDFAMLNQRLAQHYGIPNVAGSAIRRVPLPADCGRGGFLTQASVLKVTANGSVTSPVKRGAWVMTKIIGRPPEPPPPNVPAIEPDVRGTTTIREMLAKHRSDASCAACHKKIDPPGFALESYDVIGGRQTRYRSLSDEGDKVAKTETFSGRAVSYKWGQKVDTAGETGDGRPFANVDEFKKLLLENPRSIARNLVEQMAIYATGAPVSFADRAAVEKVLDKTADRRYGVRSLIQEMVQSPLFLTK